MSITADTAILTQLSKEERRILSEWRATILLRRATFQIPERDRRWDKLPREPRDVRPLLRRMERRDEIAAVPNLHGIFQVTVPYADSRPIEEAEVLMEVHPYASVSHLSAMAFHSLTDEFPNELMVTVPADGTGGLLPPGTDTDDWEGIELIRGRRVERVQGQRIRWISVQPDWYFGYREYRRGGSLVRYTTPERTLLDGLRDPELCGGLDKVLRAWATGKSRINVDYVVSYVEQFNIGILYQRVGFILEELGLSHPHLAEWQKRAHRGGSSKLSAAEPYAPTYNDRWNLSINVATDALNEPFS